MVDVVRARDLEALDRRLYEPNRYELTGRQLVDFFTDGLTPGDETYTYQYMTRAGAAKIIANGANDLPYVTTFMKEDTQKIFTIGVGYEVSLQDIRRADRLGTNIDTARAGIARRAVAEKENRLIFVGDADYGIRGLTNTVGIQTYNLPNGTDGSANWASKTGEEIEEDIRNVRGLVSVLPGHGISENLALVITPQANELLNRRYNAQDARSVRRVIEDNGWFGRIIVANELNGVGTGGTDSFMVLDRSREVVELGIAMDITRLDPMWDYPNWKYPVEERTTGVIVRYPMAIVRADGV